MTDKNSLLIIIPFICLMSLGLVMVASSSIYVADDLTGNPFHFASRQMLFVSMGLLSMSLFLLIPSDLLYKFDWIFCVAMAATPRSLFWPSEATFLGHPRFAR